MIWLWIAAALVSAGAAALIALGARRAARATDADNPALAVYRRQMAELDDLAGRGLIAEDERQSVRAETGRRLLAAADRVEPPTRAGRPGLALGLAALAPLVAAGAYLVIGAPGLADQPYARRLARWDAEVKVAPDEVSAPQMAAVLREKAAADPTNPTPLQYLALAELASNQPTEAAAAARRALALAPNSAATWALVGEAQMAEGNGEISPEAIDAFKKAQALDPTAVKPRFYLGLARIRTGDTAGGVADWRALLASLPPGAPDRADLEADILRANGMAAAQARAGAGGPGGGAVGGPQIQAMVDGLAARLKANPDDPEGWVRLVRAYAVLGEMDRRDAALANARQRYAGRSDILSALASAAQPPPAATQGGR